LKRIDFVARRLDTRIKLELSLRAVNAFAVPNQNNARHIITTGAYRRVEVKFISLSYSYPVRVFMRTSIFFFQCRRNDFDVCESTEFVSAKRPRCMRIDLYAKRPASVVTNECEFPIDNSYVSGRVHSTNRTISPVFLERGIFMCFYVLFHSATIRRIERIGRIDNIEPPFLLSVMRCDFPIDNIQVSGRVHWTNRTNRSNRQR